MGFFWMASIVQFLFAAVLVLLLAAGLILVIRGFCRR